jgi:hypothetical protein
MPKQLIIELSNEQAELISKYLGRQFESDLAEETFSGYSIILSSALGISWLDLEFDDSKKISIGDVYWKID